MTESIRIIIDWYQAYYADGVYLMLALASYLYLFGHCPELRKKFLLPMALVMFLVLNPILYKYIYSKIIYWRLFWMFPTGILIALAAVKLVKNSQGKLGKVIVLLMICALIVIKGTNIYTERGFGKIENPYKVPAAVQEVCDLMLELEEEPKCIVPEAFLCDVRQYAGEIEMAYGRDVLGFIIPIWGGGQYAYQQLESEKPVYSWILQYAVDNGCSIIVTYEKRPIEDNLLQLYGYSQVQYDGDYLIYYKLQKS